MTFVRPSIAANVLTSYEIWDGESFIGLLGNRVIVQYEAVPGKHLFLAKGDNWSYLPADLMADKKYYVIANDFPGPNFGRVVLGVLEKTDPRINEWLKVCTPKSITPDVAQKKQERDSTSVDKVIQSFTNNNILWHAEISPDDGI